MPPPRLIRLGILVPSSNTALEPLTTALLSSLPQNQPPNPTNSITAHFSRFSVTEISLSSSAQSQFDLAPILAAARLLADGHVDAIGWSGTSAGWLGLEADRALCRAITEETGVPCTTSVLGLCGILELLGVKEMGLVTPYLDEVQERILRMFGEEGCEVVAESHLGKKVNVEFAEIGEEVLDRQVNEVVGKMGKREGKIKVVSTFCTNLRAAHRVEAWESQYNDLIVLDTVATVVWELLRILDVDMSGISGWGKLFKNDMQKPG